MVRPSFGPEPLTPTAFLDRSAVVCGDRIAVVDGDVEFTYTELRDRCERLAGMLKARSVGPGDRVSLLAPNTHAALEAHYGVPWAGAVLNALNTRLSVPELAYIVGHAGSLILICDVSLADVGRAVVDRLDAPVELIECGEPSSTYETELAQAVAHRVAVGDEWGLLSLNYTSGTTGLPKGVMYAHRGAYLQALAMATQSGLDSSAVFLWTLPMFHCNGWCFPWAVTAVGGTHVALHEVRPDLIWDAIRHRGVTHFNAAPTVLTMLVNHPEATPAARTIRVATGGAPPSPSLLTDLAALNMDVTHLYGLTETYGPAVICDWRAEWDAHEPSAQAARKARQGVSNVVGMPLRVIDNHGNDVPADGETRGEVVLRGNNVMIGYYRDPEATAAATAELDGGAWFRTGDVGVMHPDNYLELRDRAKDVIISGGENIASIEVEQVLDSHPDVVESAVVAEPHDTWGEVPVAFVALRPGAAVTDADLIAHVKDRIARFKAPRRIVRGDLPKTGTGKIQKFRLRELLADQAQG